LLKFKNNQLKVLNDAKDRFFTILSHDLKNPLSAISSLSSGLNTSFNSFNKTELLNYISELDKASTNVYDLLENLLLWAKTQFYGVSIQKKEYNLYELINKSLKSVYQISKNKDIDIKIIQDKDLTVFVDQNIFKIVLLNLVTNAIKFTPEKGSILIKSETYPKGVKLIVEDNGIGISKSDMTKLFKTEENINL
jgi:signal transduction histidine kinase